MKSMSGQSDSLEKTYRDILSRHEFQSLSERLDALRPSICIQVGVLGEWNSGKSTLINALLGKKILPVMPTPTTGSITEIEPSSEEQDIKYYDINEGEEEIEIDPIAFSEIATGQRPGTVKVRVPLSGVFSSGYKFIDTPGLASLDQTHTDITFGYLPFLDGGIICHDIARGELPGTVMRFFQRNEVRPILNRFMICLTCADRKSSAGSKEIANQVRKQMQGMSSSLQSEVRMPPVVVVKALKALEGDKDALGEFESVFNQTFVEPRLAIEEERHSKALVDFGWELLNGLDLKRKALKMDDSSLKEEEQRIEADLKQLEEFQEKYRERLERLGRELEYTALSVAEKYIPVFRAATPENVNEISQEFCKELVMGMTDTAQRYGHEHPISETMVNANELVDVLKRITEQLYFVKTVTKALFEALAKEKREREREKEKKSESLINTSEKNPKEEKKHSNRYDKITDFIDKTNAIERLANWIEVTIKDVKTQNMLPVIASNAAQDTFRRIEDMMEEIIFKENKRNLSTQRDALREAVENRIHSADDLVRMKKTIEGDYDNLKKRLEEIVQH